MSGRALPEITVKKIRTAIDKHRKKVYNQSQKKSKNLSVKCWRNGELTVKRKGSALRFGFCIPLQISCKQIRCARTGAWLLRLLFLLML